MLNCYFDLTDKFFGKQARQKYNRHNVVAYHRGHQSETVTIFLPQVCDRKQKRN